LSRNWFNFCFENPEKINTNHTALYFFIIDHANRLGSKEKFGLPTSMTMECIGIKSYNTYKKTLEDIINFGFIILVQKSSNQYTSNIVALSNFNKATIKALDKATIKANQKQPQKQVESNDSIDKQENQQPIEQINNKLLSEKKFEIEKIFGIEIKLNKKIELFEIQEVLSFIENQIEKYKNVPESTEIENYKYFYKYIFENECWELLKVEKQLDFNEFVKLKNKTMEKGIKLLDILGIAINNPKYLKDKKTLYYTLNNWTNNAKPDYIQIKKNEAQQFKIDKNNRKI
jgi:hypothetical protein